MVKILILNAGWSNRGTYALTRSTMDILSQHIPNAIYTLMGTEIAQDKLPIKKQLAFQPFKNMDAWFYLAICIFINFCMHLGIKYTLNKKSPIYFYYDNDLIINSGGDQLSGEFNKFGLSSYMNIIYAMLLRKPVILHGESLGYYKNFIYNKIAKQVLGRADLILVRENISKAYLDNNVINDNTHVTADPAFILNAAEDSEINNIYSIEKIKIERPFIGINPSGLINNYTKNMNVDLNEIMARLSDKLIEDLGATILLVPHVYTSKVDDRKAIDQVFRLIRNKHKVNIIKNEYSAEELKGIIGKCDLFIGTRMHATIASTSMLVPTIGIAYSHKMHGIIGEMLDQEKYVINVDIINYDNLEKIVYDAWQNRDQIREILNAKIPIIKERSLQNGKYVKLLAESLNIDIER